MTVATVVMLVVLWQSPILAQGADGEAGDRDDVTDGFATVDIDVIGGVDWDQGRPVDARVTVTTQRAVSGTLSIVNSPEGSATTTYEFTVDLGADSSAVFPITFHTGWNGVEATATLRSNGEVVADDELQQFGDQGGDAGSVGVLGIDSPPQRIAELGTDKQLAVIPLDDRLRGLERTSSVIAPTGAISALDADSDQGRLLDGWVRGGGQLVVAGPVASPADAYPLAPSAASPTANPARFAVGSGSVIYIEDWEEGIPLGGYLGEGGLGDLVESQELGAGASGELALLANIALPAVALIAGVLFVYSLLAGPVVFGFLTARRTQRRMWTVLPLLSLVFAAGILGFGFASRSGRSEAHITIVEVNDRGSRATSNLLLTSSFGGNRRLETPPGWSYLGQGRTNGQRPTQLRVGASATEISLDMPPGSNAVARLSGTTPAYDGALTIDEVELVGDRITAEVTNNGTTDLTDAVAFLGNARSEIGDLPAGEAVSFAVDARDQTGRTMKELLIWPGVGRQWADNGSVAVPRDRDATTAAGAWTEWRIAQGTTAIPENVLGVAAWSDDLTGPVPDIAEGRTVLFARIDISSVRAEVDFRTAARLPSHRQPVFEGNFAGFIEEYRVTLGPDADVGRLGLAVTADSAALSVLTDDGWRFVELPAAGVAEFTVPPEAVIDGEILMRSHVPEWVWGAGATALVVVDPETPEVAELTDDENFRNAGDGGAGPQFQERFGPGAEAPRNLELGELTDLSDLPMDETFSGSGETSSGTHDAYVVTLAEDQLLVATMRSGSDSYLELLDSDGNLVVSNDDYGQGVDSQIRYQADSAGDYEIRAMELGNGSISYELTVVIEE